MGATDLIRRSRQAGGTAGLGRGELSENCDCKDGAQAPASASGVVDIIAGAAIGLVMSVLVLG